MFLTAIILTRARQVTFGLYIVAYSNHYTGHTVLQDPENMREQLKYSYYHFYKLRYKATYSPAESGC